MAKCMSSAVSKRATLLVAAMASFLVPFMGSSVNIALPTIGKGFTIDAVLLGWVATSYLLAAAVFLVPFGRLSDRIEPRIVASIGMALTCIGLTLLSFTNEKTTLPFIVGGLILLGFGFAFFSSPNTNAVMSSVQKKFYGVASATLGTMRLTGQMLSMGVVMLIFAVYIGRVQITAEYYPLLLQSEQVALLIFAILCFGGIFASLARGRLHSSR